MIDNIYYKKYLVGAYDRNGKVAKILIDNLGYDNIIIYTESEELLIKKYNFVTELEVDLNSLKKHEIDQINDYLVTKENLFYVSKNIIIILESIIDMSFFMRGIIELINSKIESMTVITNMDIAEIKSFLMKYGSEDEKVALENMENNGKLSINRDFFLSEFLHMLQER